VIIDNLDIKGVPSFNPEADAPLIVNTDAPLSLPFAFECLKPATWRYSQVFYPTGNIQYRKFSHGYRLDTDKPHYAFAVKHSFSITALERFNHN
jgi:hypothetical protein